ncbi:MAG: hypothetical protein MJY41_03180 [Bacteroidales bacterium]|nr:hypothetical protein [Bacteroidales bacterium]
MLKQVQHDVVQGDSGRQCRRQQYAPQSVPRCGYVERSNAARCCRCGTPLIKKEEADPF